MNGFIRMRADHKVGLIQFAGLECVPVMKDAGRFMYKCVPTALRKLRESHFRQVCIILKAKRPFHAVTCSVQQQEKISKSFQSANILWNWGRVTFSVLPPVTARHHR